MDPSPTTTTAPRGMSTGTKLLVGCGVAAFIGVAALSSVAVLGGRAALRVVESTIGSQEAQAQTTETLQTLEARHAFEIPRDGSMSADGVRRFLAVTDDAWQEMEEWASGLEDVGERLENDADLGAVLDAARGMGGLIQTRSTLAEALDRHDTPLSEYVWTGMTLGRSLEGPTGESEANRRLAEEAAQSAPWLRGPDESQPSPAVVLATAVVWGSADLSTWRALGLDTLSTR